MNIPAFLNTVGTRAYSLPIVILYVTAGCNLKCVMCSYRDPLPNELSLDEIKLLADQLSRLGLRHIVYSGGEPLTRRDFPSICGIFQKLGVKQSLLTNGLLLGKRYPELTSFFNEIIISIDGPTAEKHNAIRGVEAFDQIIKGIRNIVASPSRPIISIRTVIQRRNFRAMGSMVELAQSLGVNRISFLSADVSSSAFHRENSGEATNKNEIALDVAETVEFRELMDRFITRYSSEIQQGFISENSQKLYHIVQYFGALVGTAQYPRNQCNAPMVSAVITSTGDLLPCYFLPSIGNVRVTNIETLLNERRMRQTRNNVRSYSLQRCQECVCTLNIRPFAALMNKF